MSFTIKLYNYSGENNRLDKTALLSNETTFTGVARESIDKMQVSVLLQVAAIPAFNYAYIQEFNRYYYIDSITMERNSTCRIDMRTDVLMSHKASIKECGGIVMRNENLYNTQIIDDEMRFLGYKAVNTIKFPYKVKTGDCFILAVNGG